MSKRLVVIIWGVLVGGGGFNALEELLAHDGHNALVAAVAHHGVRLACAARQT